jgi:hypothetical protein
MRSRKPWVLARRRLLGWKVRLLTVRLRAISMKGWSAAGGDCGRDPARHHGQLRPDGTVQPTRRSNAREVGEVCGQGIDGSRRALLASHLANRRIPPRVPAVTERRTSSVESHLERDDPARG